MGRRSGYHWDLTFGPLRSFDELDGQRGPGSEGLVGEPAIVQSEGVGEKP